MSIGPKHSSQEGEVEAWLRESADELRNLIASPEASKERAFQEWLEHHPAFVPGARGPGGNSGHGPWPDALISQPRLEGIVGKQPDFCWIASDSAEVTVMLIEIETPAKRWQREKEAVRGADLTEAIEQLNAWRAWFGDPIRAAGFLHEYFAPDYIAQRHLSQHYLLIHGSRSEYAGDSVRERQRAASIRGADYQLMSFDRLPEIADSWSARFGCVRREGSGYRAIAVPAVFSLRGMTDTALALTNGYEDAVAASTMAEERKRTVLDELKEASSRTPGPARFRPGQSRQ